MSTNFPINKFFIALLLIVFLSIKASAQIKILEDSAALKMQQLYEEKNWLQLITQGERFLKSGKDSYNLRRGLGTAYYKTGNYFKAIPNLQKVVNVGYADPKTVGYLYNAYELTGREEDKNYIYNELSGRIKEKVKPLENPFAESVQAYYKKGITNDLEKNSGVDPGAFENIDADQTLSGDYSSFNAGLSQTPLKWLKISYFFSYLSQTKRKEAYYKNFKIENDYTQIQNNFYNRLDIRVSDGFVISPAFHFFGTKTMNFQLTNITDTSFQQEASVNYIEEVLGSIEISRYFSNFRIGLNGSYGKLNGKYHTQTGVSARAFPTGKINFFTDTEFAILIEDQKANPIINQSVTLKINRNLAGRIFFTIGKMQNYHEQNAKLLYNSPDIIKYKFGAEVGYDFPFNLNAYLSFEHQDLEKTFRISSLPSSVSNRSFSTAMINKLSTVGTEDHSTILKYSLNSFSAGLKFNF
ncbi:MAG: hypothetical protein SGI89_15375 [bacterium]|nr:hypothetical protein [bacterium]